MHNIARCFSGQVCCCFRSLLDVLCSQRAAASRPINPALSGPLLPATPFQLKITRGGAATRVHLFSRRHSANLSSYGSGRAGAAQPHAVGAQPQLPFQQPHSKKKIIFLPSSQGLEQSGMTVRPLIGHGRGHGRVPVGLE